MHHEFCACFTQIRFDCIETNRNKPTRHEKLTYNICHLTKSPHLPFKSMRLELKSKIPGAFAINSIHAASYYFNANCILCGYSHLSLDWINWEIVHSNGEILRIRCWKTNQNQNQNLNLNSCFGLENLIDTSN